MGTIWKIGGFLAALPCSKLLHLLAPQVGLEPTTLRLTAECLRSEYTCFQRSTEEETGRIGASGAHNSAKNSAKPRQLQLARRSSPPAQPLLETWSWTERFTIPPTEVPDYFDAFFWAAQR